MKFAFRSIASIAAVASTLILAGVAVAPASYAEEASGSMQENKDTMHKDAMDKDTMDKDTMHKDAMDKDDMNKDEMKK
jgi:pentapeptide MXKDX repeat protein